MSRDPHEIFKKHWVPNSYFDITQGTKMKFSLNIQTRKLKIEAKIPKT